jgi:polysaccharide export outer membrane protein
MAALAALALIAALGCATAAAPPPKAGAYEGYRVGAPDQLSVTVLPDPAITQEVVVRPDGMISVPLIGDVPASGRTAEEIAADVEKRIERYKRGAKVTVAVTATNSTAVTVLGEVRSPSSFPLLRATRVVEAIGQVGGTAMFASKRRVRVIRSGGGETVVFKVNLSAIQAGDLRSNILLATGDIVYVPPTLLARVGYHVSALLFPFQPLLGVAMTVGGNLITP